MQFRSTNSLVCGVIKLLMVMSCTCLKCDYEGHNIVILTSELAPCDSLVTLHVILLIVHDHSRVTALDKGINSWLV